MQYAHMQYARMQYARMQYARMQYAHMQYVVDKYCMTNDEIKIMKRELHKHNKGKSSCGKVLSSFPGFPPLP